MLDLDGLKEVNDSLGHQAGDERIRALADCMRATMRVVDSGYRIGGDEFMVLLPDQAAWGAYTFAQRFQREASRHRTGVSFSCGIAETTDPEDADALVRKADLALYEAKRSGRRVVVYSDSLAPKPSEPSAQRATRHQQRLLATALARAVDAKDAGTRNHCETVSELCVLIAFSARPRRRADRAPPAGGAAARRRQDRRRRTRFSESRAASTADEAATMSSHVRIGHAIVAAAELEDEARWVLHHHEHLDGSGYPLGLRGDEIPLESRIILVADAFEAMTADRPYRNGLPRGEAALAELERLAGDTVRPCLRRGAALRSLRSRN